MAILVTGATGLLGRALMRQLEGENLVGVGLSRSGAGVIRCDLRDGEAVRALCDEIKPSIIIHAAAQRDPDVCEHDEVATSALNIRATRTLVNCANEHKAWIIYISTDYVFDGCASPYLVDDQPNPINAYGKSKLAGEDVLREADQGLVVRVPVLYGQVESLEESAVTVVARAILNGEKKFIDHWGRRFPTHTDDIGLALLALIRRGRESEPIVGTIHISAAEVLTKYDQACLMAEVLGRDASILMPNPDEPGGAPRPKDCQLDTARLQDLVDVSFRSFRSGISEAFSGLGLIP